MNDTSSSSSTISSPTHNNAIDTTTANLNQDDNNSTSSSLNNDNEPMIALYYCYTPTPINDVTQHISFQKDLCSEHNLNGRIRVSSEGINGVLSGTKLNLECYEHALRQEIVNRYSSEKDGDDANPTNNNNNDNEDSRTNTGFDYDNPKDIMDVKYCQLRNDLDGPPELQMFDSLSIKETREVVSLHEHHPQHQPQNTKKKKNYRRRRRNRLKQEQREKDAADTSTTECDYANDNHEESNIHPTKPKEIITPAPHLTPQQWHNSLLSTPTTDSIIIDARNIYESNVGRFSVPNVPTLLTNTRKYSSLPKVLEHNISEMAGKHVYMYCTGGVRCERASQYLLQLNEGQEWKGKGIEGIKGVYQLGGGIQKYLEVYGSTETTTNGEEEDDEDGSNNPNQEKCLYQGKNFVFDPRRTDPMVNPETPIVGECVLCDAPHDDYDNGYAPCQNKEARCCRCRVLVLVCDKCRLRVRCWGEDEEKEMEEEGVVVGTNTQEEEGMERRKKKKPDLFCGGRNHKCVDEGNTVDHVQLIHNKG